MTASDGGKRIAARCRHSWPGFLRERSWSSRRWPRDQKGEHLVNHLNGVYVNEGQNAAGDLSGTCPNPGIADAAVGASEIETGSVGAAEIVTDGVGAEEIAPSSVGSEEATDNSLGAIDLAPASVGGQ